MSARWRRGVFLAASALQIAVPLVQIVRYEQVLRHGHVYRFRCEPVDPADVFRGRYVRIQIPAATVTQSWDRAPTPRGWVAASLEIGPDGLAHFGRLGRWPPATGDWLKVRWSPGPDHTGRVIPPFDRLYLPERVAPEVEAEYARTALSATNRPPVVVVRVRGGRGVIEDLELGGVPVRAWLRSRGMGGGAGRAR
ncbi:MAG: GDYXXLXY domain-containing protein [Kiritimatiellae bacterium]|nr:GDYXXLXY domain-containing protein [Kiritimatiellia bacterium]